MNTDSVLIVGCGDVGNQLALRLINDFDFSVWGLKRTTSTLLDGIKPIKADVTIPETLLNLPKPLEYVIFCAASRGFSDQAYQQVYVEGLSNLLKALSEQRISPKCVFFTSSTSVYHQCDGEWVDETTPTKPTGFSGKRLLEAETLLTNSNFNSCIVRFSGIYGPGRTRLIKQIQDLKGVDEEPPLWTNRIHRDDCAGALSHLINRNRQGFRLAPLYIASDHEPALMWDLQWWLAEQLAVVDLEVDYDSDVPRRGNKRCSSKLLVDSGYQFIYKTYKEGYSELLAEQGY